MRIVPIRNLPHHVDTPIKLVLPNPLDSAIRGSAADSGRFEVVTADIDLRVIKAVVPRLSPVKVGGAAHNVLKGRGVPREPPMLEETLLQSLHDVSYPLHGLSEGEVYFHLAQCYWRLLGLGLPSVSFDLACRRFEIKSIIELKCRESLNSLFSE